MREAVEVELVEDPAKIEDDGPALERERLWARGRAWSNRSRWVRLGSVLAVIVAWQIASAVANNRLMPSFTAIVSALFEELQNGRFWDQVFVTLQRGFTGFLIACVAGSVLGFVMARNRVADAIVEPFLAATYPVPKIALYPFFIFIFGIGSSSKIALVALECLYPIAYNVYRGVRSTPGPMLSVAANVGASRFRRFRQVIAPSALPSFLTGVRVALPIMLLVIVVTELIGESRGMGFLIRNFSSNFQPQKALAVVLFLGILGWAFDRLIVLIDTKVVFWKGRSDV